jgi:alpha-1,3-rhamnosyl/mannosyltransferase
MGDIGELNHDRSTAGMLQTIGGLGLLWLVNRGVVPAGLAVPRADLFHASNLMRQSPGNCKLTATIHDVTAWLRPDLHRPATLQADQYYVDHICRAADGLIAVSAKSKDDAVETIGLDPNRIAVVHNGVSEAYFSVTEQEIENVRRLYSIRKSFVLFVSTVEPRKNLDMLVSAYEQLSDDLRHEFELLVAGPAGWNCEATLRRIQTHRGGVRYLGYVPEPHLPALFASAALFAYPSLYEGFGLPVLQAMAAGTPVLTAATGALPEVAGDCALYADPYSLSDLTVSLRNILLSPAERTRLAECGRVRARQFTWAACAAKTWVFFRTVTGL